MCCNWNEQNLNTFMSIDCKASLVPAAPFEGLPLWWSYRTFRFAVAHFLSVGGGQGIGITFPLRWFNAQELSPTHEKNENRMTASLPLRALFNLRTHSQDWQRHQNALQSVRLLSCPWSVVRSLPPALPDFRQLCTVRLRPPWWWQLGNVSTTTLVLQKCSMMTRSMFSSERPRAPWYVAVCRAVRRV